MEKAGTPSNRLTRSSTRNTPSKKAEDTSDIIPEELKHNRRKSRRITDTNSRTNGDTSTDMDSKKLRSYEEISDGNSMDSVESNISFKQKCSPKSKNHKTSSPTISRKSLRPRRSVTPGPEVETSMTKKMTRSTSEGKLDSLSTPTKRSMRAKSESKDFVFTPTKRYDSDKEQPPPVNKCIPINSELRVIDETIEEENEVDTCTKPKSSPKIPKTLETVTTDSDSLVVTNYESKLKSKYSCEESSINESFCKDSQSDSYVDTHTASSGDANKYLEKEEVEMVVEQAYIQDDNQLPIIVEENTLEKKNNELPVLEEACDDKELISQDDFSLKETNKQFIILDTADKINKSNDELLLEEAESAEDTSYNLSVSDDSEIVIAKPLEDTSNGLKYDDQVIILPKESVDSIKNNTSILENTHSQNVEHFKNDSCLLKNTLCNETNDGNGNLDEISQVNDTKSPRLSLPQPSTDQSKLVVSDNGSNVLPKKTLHSDSENNTSAENNNLTLATEIKIQDENLVDKNEESATIEIANYEQSSSPKCLVESRPYEDEECVVVCGSDSDEVSNDLEESCVSKSVVQVDCEQVAQSDIRQMKDINCESINEDNVCISGQTTNAEMNDNNSLDVNDMYSSTQVEEDTDTDIVVNIGVEHENIEEESEIKDIAKVGANDVEEPIKQPEHAEDPIKSPQHSDNPTLERSLSQDMIDGAKKLVEIFDEDEYQKKYAKESKTDLKEDPIDDTMGFEKESDIQLKENDEHEGSEENDDHEGSEENNEHEGSEGKTSNRDSECDSELYKNMSDFGSDVDEKKDGSQSGDSVSSELQSGESEEYASSFEGEEDDEETNNEENVISNELENSQKNNNSKPSEKLFDTSLPLTYDKALAILNKDRVKKIDDEEFFDMFTEELNKVSGESSDSDSDIAIVDEYIADPEEQEQQKSFNQKPGNPPTNLKTLQQSASNSIQNRPTPPKGTLNQQGPTQIKINLKTSKKSDLPPNSIPVNFSGAYSQPVQTEHSYQNMARMNFSQGEIYHQYNSAMPNMDSNRDHTIYDQFAPTNNIQDARMFQPHHVSHDNYNRGMYVPLGQLNDEQIHYSGGSPLKVRNMESMCGTYPQNAFNLNSNNSERPIPINPMRNSHDKNDGNMGISTATMTETNTSQDQQLSFRYHQKNVGAESNPVLNALGLDKKQLKMLKKVLGLNGDSKEKQRSEIKEILLEEVQKMGLSVKTPENRTDNRIDRKQTIKAKHAAKMKQAMKKIDDSDSSVDNFVGSCTEHSSKELSTNSEQSSCVSSDDQSSKESSDDRETGRKKMNFNDDNLPVVIVHNPQRKMRHRARAKHLPFVTDKNDIIHKQIKVIKNSPNSNPSKKRRVLQSESSDEENVRQKKRKKPSENKIFMFSGASNDKKNRQGKKMTKGRSPNKKKSTVLQSKSGTFTVDPVTGTSQSESDTFSQDETANYLEELKKNMKKNLAPGKNKLPNMFTQHSLREGKKSVKRKVDTAFEMTEQATKTKRLPADLLANLGNEKKKAKLEIDEQSSVLGTSETLTRKRQKPKKRAIMKKLKVDSAAAHQDYIPLVTAGSTQFGLKRLDKEGLLSAAEQAAKFRSERLFGTSVKRITSQGLLNVKKKQHMNEWVVEKEKKKAANRSK